MTETPSTDSGGANERAGLGIRTELGDGERFVRTAIDAAPIDAIVVDGEGTVVFATESVADVLGYSPDELADEPFADFVVDADGSAIAPADDTRDRLDGRLRCADGETVRARIDVRGFEFDGERYYTAVIRDSSAREPEERTIDRYDAITGIPEYGVYHLDRDGRFEMVNDTIVDALGYSRDELLGEHASAVVDEDDLPECRSAVEGLLTDGEPRTVTVEFAAHTADGDAIPCEARVTAIEPEGTDCGTVGIVRDVSDRKERAEELRQERGLNEHVLETSPVGIGVITPDGDISRVNDRAEALLGLTMEELSDQTFDVSQRKLYDSEGHRISPEDLLSRVFDDHEEVIDTEFALERPDGDQVWASISIAPMTDAAGDVEKAAIIATDITDRKEREETLREERDVIEHILETSPVGIGVITADGDISRVNDRAEELLGLTIGEITNQTLDVTQRRFYGASGQQVQPEDLLSRVFEDREHVLNSEFRLERPDGERVWTALSIAPIENQGGDVEKAVVIATDISDRKEREKRLRESEARLRQIAENINSAIWMADADLSEILYINPAYENITGRSRDSVYDNLMNHLDDVHPQDRHRVETAMQEVTQTPRNDGTAIRFQEKYRIVQPDSSIRWVTSFAFPLQNDDGDVYRFVGVIDDITEVKEQQLELGRQRDELETLNQINTVIRRINQGVVQAADRAAIEREVCETLTDSKLYHAAWTGEVDTGTREVTPKTDDGLETASIDRSFDIDAVDAISMAVESGDIQLIRNVAALPEELPVTDASPNGAFESEHSSAAVIPLIYKETVYDVLVAYSSRANAFSVREQAVLFELGKTIGLAINAVERKAALLTDAVVELEFEIRDPDVFFVSASDELGVEFEMEGITSQSDGTYLQYFTVTGCKPDRVLERAGDEPGIERARIVAEDEDENGALVEFIVGDSSLATALAEYGGTVRSARFAEGRGTCVSAFSQTADVREVVEAARSTFARTELVGKRERERSVHTGREFRTALEELLTERQRTVLETAYYAGYFEWPRDSSGENVADSLDVAPATFHQHIREGVQKLVETLIEGAAAA
ncbi:putative PAS/PAC sensor protein [Haloterrigena turkmenica DSM 5511]|uniref:PAS/PAC sensor protein n=1 Tax=Haloterrigena turkmenica (strain ATCC 51198 / DSM 5511 / JCM 9101 / NCIMB 13204 / VKM B-1734 / 4k) TaxID=543526 RepID=D2RQU6_HALTV|nr:PAS domain S-box protein [Haloterrigena turkmenica]ADB60427.1 putative PAS/PAC sensor protein [Haloterrigena turkmenica DSM 5511]